MQALEAVRSVLSEWIDHETIVTDHKLVEVHFKSGWASNLAEEIRDDFRRRIERGRR